MPDPDQGSVASPPVSLPGSQGLHPEFARRLAGLHGDVSFTITSGYRSSQQQQKLFDLFKAGKGNPANRPGTSNHEGVPFGPAEGLAADIHGDYSRLHAAAAKHKLHFPVAKERWHCQPIEAISPKYTRQVLGPASDFPALGPEPEAEIKVEVRKDQEVSIFVSPPGGAVFITDGRTKRAINTPAEMIFWATKGSPPIVPNAVKPDGSIEIHAIDPEIFAGIPEAK
jgi:hypothetical protein